MIEQTLSLWRSTCFIWGESDCMLSIGDYIARCGGLDVTGRFRGRYGDEVGARRFLEQFGGPAGLIGLTGIPETDDPKRGDVVVLDTGYCKVGALCIGDRVAARLERGVIEVRRISERASSTA